MENKIFGLFEKFKAMKLDTKLIGFELVDGIKTNLINDDLKYRVIARNGDTLFAFIEGYKDMVFVVDPIAKNGHKLYPIANSFRTFLALVLSCGNTQIIQNMTVWDKHEYINHIYRADLINYVNSPEVLDIFFAIKFDLGIKEMSSPYEYINFVVTSFDYERYQNAFLYRYIDRKR